MKQTLKDFCSYPVLLFKACITLITSPKLLIYALIPYLIALLLEDLSVFSTFRTASHPYNNAF